ncbi:hypothetical protein ABNIH7_03921 [Acinetobacter baumannii ABNIH7]|nr:hypothetical protein ABNIH11_12966 [Acinetobacter baumannii ABNIH11]EMU05752.1 hypothetical protein ABNIH7_03921 [Acinetobacter baumannii ABNIH7]
MCQYLLLLSKQKNIFKKIYKTHFKAQVTPMKKGPIRSLQSTQPSKQKT